MLVSARQESPCVRRFEHRNSSKPETAHSLRPRPSLARPVLSSVRPRKDRTVAPRAIPCSKAHKDDRATSSTPSAQANAASRDWWPTTRRKANHARRLEIPRSSMWGLPRAAGANRRRDRWAWTGNSPERPAAQRKNPEARRERRPASEGEATWQVRASTRTRRETAIGRQERTLSKRLPHRQKIEGPLCRAAIELGRARTH